MKIYLTGRNVNLFALADDDAPALVRDANWSLSTNGYAKTNVAMGDGRFTSTMMHRVVVGALVGEEVDHINRNKLDNRRENLRIATRFENARNKDFKVGKATGYKGVSVSRASLGYIANINVDGRTVYLGTYPSAESAALAYDDKLIELDGDLAVVNGVSEEYRQPVTKQLKFSGVLKSGKARSATGFWGVSRQSGGKFSAIYFGERLGTFVSAELAAEAYDVRAKGDGYYRVNFPD